MAKEKALQLVSFPAAETFAALQFSVVNIASDGEVEPADAAEFVLGVIQNNPSAAGRAASVAIGGISKVRATGGATAIVPGTKLICGTNGEAVAESTGGLSYVFGRALESLSTGSTGIIACLITHEGQITES